MFYFLGEISISEEGVDVYLSAVENPLRAQLNAELRRRGLPRIKWTTF